MIKMVGWFPRGAVSASRSGSLTVRTSRDSLLVAVNSKEQPLWTYSGDHLRR